MTSTTRNILIGLALGVAMGAGLTPVGLFAIAAHIAYDPQQDNSGAPIFGGAAAEVRCAFCGVKYEGVRDEIRNSKSVLSHVEGSEIRNHFK